MKRALLAFVSGSMFAAGLALSGMTQPSKVLGFLDVSGAWDPSLAFVMAGAVLVYALGSRWILSWSKPLLDGRFHLSSRTRIDRRLVVGTAIFGVGWGLSGLCPGPAIASLGANPGAVVFVGAMALGQWLEAALHRRVFAAGAGDTHQAMARQ